jgi:hypothetical protein
MPQKIFDISPPKKEKPKKELKLVKKETLRVEKLPAVEKKSRLKIHFPKITFPKISLKNFLFLIFVLVVIAIFTLSFNFSKAEIKIWPKTDEVSFVETITIDTNAQSPNLDKKIIPGKMLEIEETFSNSFNSSGKILKKAEGIIRLFNEYTTQDEVWKEGTRFVSSDGKLFKSKDKIYIPGAKIKNGKIEASFVDVPVVAAEGGTQYNIGPSDFSVVALKGSPRYFKYYGKSFQPMKGGGEFPVVTKEDLERAEKELINLANQKAKEILKSKIENDFSFSEDNVEISVLEKNTSVKEGEEKENFDFQIKVKIKTIVFSKKDLSGFAKEYLSSKIQKDKEIHLPSLKTEIKEEVRNFELGKATFQLKISGMVFPKLDSLIIKKGIAGKTLEETKFFLLNQNEISKTKIEVFPFWVKRIPDDINKIEISYPVID